MFSLLFATALILRCPYASSQTGMRLEAISNIPSSELNALYDLYNSTMGIDWKWNPFGNVWNFSSSDPNPCTENWQGITCTTVANTRHILNLQLQRYKLIGTIPDSICNLTHLEMLDLDENKLYGQIPHTLDSMKNLQQLILSENSLTGAFPTLLCNMTELTNLSIDNNFFNGTIPQCVADLTELTIFFIDSNFFYGPFPTPVQALLNLTILSLSRTQFTGTVPLFVCNFTDLAQLYLGHIGLTGTLPDCLGGLSKLQNIGLENNLFSGTVPQSLGLLPGLITIWMDDNEFTGSIPAFAVQPSVTELLLNDNRFSGTFPDCFAIMTNLRYLGASNNYFSGPVPATLGVPTLNYVIDLSENLFSGTVPATFAKVVNIFQLLLYNNFLSGSLDSAFNASVQVRLTSVLVHQNQFTGTLPQEAFRLPLLNTFTALGNCFTGTLSEAICNVPNLISLILDGLHTSTACRKSLLPALHTYGVTNKFQGTIPTCLLQMPRLTSLHLSGNSLTGTLPDVANLSEHMLDLTVSHNALTGTVPLAVQTHNWRNLDLSYNRIAGTLDDAFASNIGLTAARLENFTFNSTAHSLVIQNNRLSGGVPSALVHMTNVTTLGSNMFSCKLDRSDLPQHDNDKENYQCDSVAFNGPFYAFLIVVAITALALFASMRSLHSVAAQMQATVRKWMADLDNAPRNVVYVRTAGEILCKLGVWCTVLVVVVLVPWYTAASHYMGTYTHQYAWVTSAAFLSGAKPLAGDLVLYCAMMVALVVGAGVIVVNKDKMERQRSSSRSSTNLGISSTDAAVARTVPIQRWQRVLVYITFLSVNVIIVAGVNASFVVVALTKSSTALIFSQVALSVFKLMWNTMCVPFLIHLTKGYIAQTSTNTSLVTVQVFIGLFNNIAIPCLVVAVLSPSCFNSLFVPPSSVTSDFIVQGCYIGAHSVICSFYQPVALTATFSPPFQYDYQCSSSFVTYYAPAFVYLGFAAAIGAPAAKMVGMHLLQRAALGTRWHKVLAKVVPRLLKPPKEKRQVQDLSSDTATTLQLAMSLWERYTPLFDANNFIVALITYLGIMLTFGVVFPPLAAVMCLTMLSVAWQTNLELGRYLHNAKEAGSTHLIESIERECRGAVSMEKLRRSLFLIICFCCGFYALFLFDTLGDAVGLHKALWVLFVMPSLMLALYAAVSVRRFYRNDVSQQLGFSLEDETRTRARKEITVVDDGSGIAVRGAILTDHTAPVAGTVYNGDGDDATYNAML